MSAFIYGMEDKEVRSRVDGEHVKHETTTAIHENINLIVIEACAINLHPSWHMDGCTHTIDVYSGYTGKALHTYGAIQSGCIITGSTVCYHFNIIDVITTRATRVDCLGHTQGEGSISK